MLINQNYFVSLQNQIKQRLSIQFEIGIVEKNATYEKITVNSYAYHSWSPSGDCKHHHYL